MMKMCLFKEAYNAIIYYIKKQEVPNQKKSKDMWACGMNLTFSLLSTTFNNNVTGAILL